MVESGLTTRNYENPLVPQLTVENLTKHFPAPNGTIRLAVDGICLSVGAGERCAILGPSGSGKTTLLRLIAGLERPDAGNIKLGETLLNGVPPKDRNVAMVFQQPALLPHLTAARNLALGLMLRGLDRATIRQKVDTMASQLGITECLSRKPAEISGGERQRVALGRALISRPQILLLDEPFGQIDAPLRRALRRELLRLHQETMFTLVLVTHDQAAALALGTQVAIINAGRLEQVGPPATLRENPATPFVESFLDDNPI